MRLMTDAVRKLHTGGAKAEFPWVVIGLGIFALQLVIAIGAIIASWFGY